MSTKPKTNGYMLSEIIIGLIITGMVLLGIFVIYITAHNIWQAASIQAKLTQKTNLALDTMLRGVDGRNGLREAAAFTIVSSSGITYASASDTVTRGFYLSGTELHYLPDDSIQSLNVHELVFNNIFDGQPSNRRLHIKITEQESVKGKTISCTMETDVCLRNYTP